LYFVGNLQYYYKKLTTN